MSSGRVLAGLREIVSGGQTGVDRAALDIAEAFGLARGGWCPRGRLAEDGPIPAHYPLQEHSSPTYAARTEQNVIDSDATLILSRGEMTGGTELTWRMAIKHGRPRLRIDLGQDADPQQAADWIAAGGFARLNVAGPRASIDAEIYALAADYLRRVLMV